LILPLPSNRAGTVGGGVSAVRPEVTRAIRKISPGELLTEHETKEKLLYTKNTHILNLLLIYKVEVRIRKSKFDAQYFLVFPKAPR
jgi:hypothetical protein